MPRFVTFNNRKVLEPNTYAQSRGGEPIAPDVASFGNVLIIDTGLGANYGGGSGINGEKYSAKDAIYEFDNIIDFQKWMRGGMINDAAKYLFRPTRNPAQKGADKLYFVSAKTSTPSEATLSFGAGTGVAATGTITVTVLANIAGDTFSIGGHDIVVGVDFSIAGLTTEIEGATALVAAINAHPSISNLVTADNVGGTVAAITLTAKIPGLPSNSIALTYTDSGSGVGATVSGATLSGGSQSKGGYVKIKTLAEGDGSIGVVNGTSSDLQSGFGFKIIAGTNDTTAVKVQFYKGTYQGVDPVSGKAYDRILPENAVSELVAESDEFTSFADFLSWAEVTPEFNNYFYLVDGSSFTLTDGSTSNADAIAGMIGFHSGSETYSASDLNDVLDAIPELDNTYFLVDKYGVSDGVDTENTAIWAHILNEARFEKFMVVGGGKDYTQSVQTSASTRAMAAYYDSERVYVVHSDVWKDDVNEPTGERRYNTFYHAAAYCGFLAGLEPQTPSTNKTLVWDRAEHDAKLKDREVLLKSGVVHLKDRSGEWVVNQEVNTLQANTQAIYPSGKSPEGSIMRISAALNKTLSLNFDKRSVGKNRNTSSPADVKSLLESILASNTAKPDADSLIIKAFDTRVTLKGVDYEVSYGYETNGPINRVFITSYIYTPTVTA